jgi:GntR family transcriptional regulator, transcriptional repressor for pyruvate dehydrogenase complex
MARPSRERTLKANAPPVRTTLTASAFEQLITYLVSGDWMAGDRIPPKHELCQQLAIARTSLREALTSMELIGMLENRVGDGTFVCDRSEFLFRPLLWAFTRSDGRQLHDILEAQEFIERDLAGLAAERGSDEEIEAIGAAVERVRELLARGESIFDADSAFHLAIADAAHNEVLRKTVKLLRSRMRQWIVFKYPIPDAHNNVLKQHEAIFRVIRERDAQAARITTWQYLEDSAHFVFQVMERETSASQNGRKRKSVL